MLEHIRHVLASARYNRRSLLRPDRMLYLVSSWYDNEMAFLRRTNRLRDIVQVDNRVLNEAFRESSAVTEHCRLELQQYPRVLPGLLNPNYGPVLYALARLLRPEVVVETGVGSGVSSTFFLSAMEQNAIGRLYSIDLPIPEARLLPPGKETGWLVPQELRARWTLTLGDSRVELPALLERLGKIDFFYHDSDHSYEHMTWEYSAAYPYIRPGGLLLSDDIRSNQAWEEFTSARDGHSVTINRTGIHRKSSA